MITSAQIAEWLADEVSGVRHDDGEVVSTSSIVDWKGTVFKPVQACFTLEVGEESFCVFVCKAT